MEPVPKISLLMKVILLIRHPRLWSALRATRYAKRVGVVVEGDWPWTHALAGGDSQNVVEGLLRARELNLNVAVVELQAVDFIGVRCREAVDTSAYGGQRPSGTEILQVANALAGSSAKEVKPRNP